MNNIVLDVKNLTKKFGSKGKEFTAVDNISFSISDGEILGVLGPNGAGKTTTIQMLLGVMEQTSGTIEFFGKAFKKHREEILKEINFSSTYISMPWLFKVSQILDIYGRLYEIPDRQKRIEKLAKEFEIEHLLKKQFYMLSAGEQTRLLMTKAFLNYPKLLLLDEPTASLDPDIAVKIREFIKKERKEYNVSVLFTSHNMSEVEEICDRVIILSHGKIIAEDSPENLTKRITECTIELSIPQKTNDAYEYFKKNSIQFTQTKYSYKITIKEKLIGEFLMKLAKEKISYQEISIKKPDLEDYFLQVIGEQNET